MYCSGCGTQLEATLNFCNRCGNRVPKSGELSVGENLAGSISYVGGFGFVGFIFVAVVLLQRGVPMEAFVPIAAFYLAALVTVCWLILKYSAQMVGGRRSPVESDVKPSPAELVSRITAQLDEPRSDARVLAEHRGPVPSVTDHTTRALEHVPLTRDRQS